MYVEGAPFVSTGMKLVLLVDMQEACADILAPRRRG